YRVVSLNAPQGTVTNCTWPAPVVGGWETQTRLVDVIFRALLPALPERLPAGTKAMMCHAGFGGVDALTNEYYCFLETFGGGYGLIRDGAETRLPAKTTLEVLPGDTISYRTCGGGGYGPPLDRDPERVARDVREGKVSLERAKAVYGWHPTA